MDFDLFSMAVISRRDRVQKSDTGRTDTIR